MAVELTEAHHILLHWPRHRTLTHLGGLGVVAQAHRPAGRHVDIRIDSYPDLIRLTGLITAHLPILLRAALREADAHRIAVQAFLRRARTVFELQAGGTEVTPIATSLAEQRITAQSRYRPPR